MNPPPTPLQSKDVERTHEEMRTRRGPRKRSRASLLRRVRAARKRLPGGRVAQ